MAIFPVPVIFYVEAAALSEAQKIIVDWGDQLTSSDYPDGTDTVDFNVSVEADDEGRSVVYIESEDEDDLGDDDDDDDDYDSSDEDPEDL